MHPILHVVHHTQMPPTKVGFALHPFPLQHVKKMLYNVGPSCEGQYVSTLCQSPLTIYHVKWHIKCHFNHDIQLFPSMGLSMLDDDWGGFCFQGCWMIQLLITREGFWVWKVLGVVDLGIIDIGGANWKKKGSGKYGRNLRLCFMNRKNCCRSWKTF
jgi:hypothetical protein